MRRIALVTLIVLGSLTMSDSAHADQSTAPGTFTSQTAQEHAICTLGWPGLFCSNPSPKR